MRRTPTTASIAATTLIATAGLLCAGPLSPPPGGISSTMKTLTEVEPRIAINTANTPGDNDATPSLYKITHPGSYYLTGDITGVPSWIGIEIVSAGVTIDLNGFEVRGAPGSVDGIATTAASLTGIEIKNGSVRGWGRCGINLGLNPTKGSTLRDLRATGNDTGISAGMGAVVMNCTATENSGNGLVASLGSALAGCTAIDNESIGIATGAGSTIADCAAYSNVGYGFNIGADSTVSNSSARFNAGHGFGAFPHCTLSGCSAGENSQNGFSLSSGATVTNCAAAANCANGFEIDGESILLNNTASHNGDCAAGAGIKVNGGHNRLEGNNCTLADFGIQVIGPFNIIVRNTCAANSMNWSIQASNFYGPVMDLNPLGSVGFQGNGAPGNLGSTDPNANFTN